MEQSIHLLDGISMQVVALSVLATALGKGEESLQYLCQEHSVSQLVNVWYIVQCNRPRNFPSHQHTLPYQQLARLPNASVVEHLFVNCHSQEIAASFILV